jgi:CcmD family protein
MHKEKENTSVLDFLSSHSLFVVLFVALVVWLGVFLYMMRIEKKLKELEGQRNRG